MYSYVHYSNYVLVWTMKNQSFPITVRLGAARELIARELI